MKIHSYISSLLACLVIALPGHSQVNRNETLIRSVPRRLEYEVKAEFSIGGITPLPPPVEIRSIDGCSPTLVISIGGGVTKWFAVQNKLGAIVGLRLENKAMTTEATVKNYNMEILGQGGERISGVWTGGVRTKAHTSGLTIPLMATYKLSNRWNIKAGLYFSYLFSRESLGHVYEGYLCEGDPVGPKVKFTDGEIAIYNFSDDLRHFQWGLQIGVRWRAFKRPNIYVNLTWGLSGILRNDLQTITLAMYPTYLDIGFGYAF